MQIKTNQTTKKPSNTDLVRRWLEMTLPPIAGLIILPYLFLFLGSLYTKEFHNIPAQTLVSVVGVQGIVVAATPIITAWIMLKRVSQQMQSLAQAISKSADKISETTFANDNWVSLEKQHDDVGRVARQIKAAFLGKNSNQPVEMEIEESLERSQDDSESSYSSLFTLHVQETNTQLN